MRTLRGSVGFIVVLHLLFLLTLSRTANAQSPVDPLRPTKQNLNRYSYSFRVEYVPSGSAGIGMDDDNGLYQYTLQTTDLTYSGSFEYNLNEAVSLDVSAEVSSETLREERVYGADDYRDFALRNVSNLRLSIGTIFRLSRTDPYAPTLAAFATMPDNFQMRLSASYVRDPTVLSASLGYMWDDSDSGDLLLSMSSGFIANDRVNFAIRASHTIPQGRIQPSTTSLGLQQGYSLDSIGDREIVVGLSLSQRGEDNWMGFDVTFAGRMP